MIRKFRRITMSLKAVSFSGIEEKKPTISTPITPTTGDITTGLKLPDQPHADTFVKSEEAKETPSGKKVSKDEFAKLQSRNDEVRKHEEAHQMAGGSLASSPVYEYNEYGYIQNGHVNIGVPELNKDNPEKSLEQAKIVQKAATAPETFSELSDADRQVATKAENIINKSQDLIYKKEHNIT